ncbi:MAG TPA: hypothetical protein VFS08_10100 [Gemmatimonadaceae bacterium]|nr:hypothetical protein [Gemmatimonadaceae bacterium]
MRLHRPLRRAVPVLCGALLALAAPRPLAAQQVADSAFVPDVGGARWPAGTGPRLVLDEAHGNFHTLAGRYTAFGRLARAVGFRVAPHGAPFTDASLHDVDVLVIANALAPRNAGGNWRLPTPSAFTREEIAAVHRFVERGGGLLLIADHMPFAGAAEALGRVLGVQFANAFALDTAGGGGPLVFRRGQGLTDTALVSGVTPVDSVVTFTGSAFRLLGEGTPLLALPDTLRLWLPTQAWVFGDTVPSLAADGWLQGAARRIGRGRVVVLGEAAMLSAQLSGPQRTPMGMNAPVAAQNARWAARLLRWLAGDATATR